MSDNLFSSYIVADKIVAEIMSHRFLIPVLKDVSNYANQSQEQLFSIRETPD